MGWIADLLKEVPSAARYKSELESMERENTKLAMENSELKSEIKILETQIIDLRQEIQRRDNIIKEQKSNIHNKPLDDNKINILIELSEKPKTVKDISTKLNSGVVILQYHLNELKANKMISETHVAMGVGNLYSLEQNGLEYLIKNKLIK